MQNGPQAMCSHGDVEAYAQSSDPRDRLIVALDVSSADAALSLADTLGDRCRWLKIGMELFYAEGQELIRRLQDRGFCIFLDLKLHDIPNTTAAAVRSVTSLRVQLLTLHASGGAAMMQAASARVDQLADAPLLAAVTVLTSMDEEQLKAISIDRTPQQQVLRLAALALGSGIRALITSPLELLAAAQRVWSGANLDCSWCQTAERCGRRSTPHGDTRARYTGWSFFPRYREADYEGWGSGSGHRSNPAADGSWLRVRPALGLHRRVTQAKGKGSNTAATAANFRHRTWVDSEAFLPQTLSDGSYHLSHEGVSVKRDHVAGKLYRFRLRDDQAAVRQKQPLCKPETPIKGIGIVQDKSARQRSEAGIKIIEARVDQLQRLHRTCQAEARCLWPRSQVFTPCAAQRTCPASSKRHRRLLQN